MKRSILVVDDEADMTHLLKRSLEPDLGCRVITADSGAAALKVLSEQRIDLVLADIKMPGMNGMELLGKIKQAYSDITVLMMTAYGSIETAVEAMRQGAYDFITKPFDHDALLVRLEKALERSSLIRENLRLRRECSTTGGFQGLVGKSLAMQRVFETIRTVANTDLTVLITGESGTGKDLTARAVHALSDRAHGPFVPVNCPTVPENILESELFGYKKGAFTHATRSRVGLFQESEGGTIFLDEIGDISPTIQTKLLRVLQEKEIKPLGGNRISKVDVRIIASTNKNLMQKIKQGTFREDFFYRLNILPIELPPLRQRREDIPLIVNHLIQKHCQKLDKPVKNVSSELMQFFAVNDWEGNVRELENVIIQSILFSAGKEICLQDIRWQPKPMAGNPKNTEMASDLLNMAYKPAKEETLKHFNARYIGHILDKHQGNVTQAARDCGLERQSLQQIMRRYKIKADRFRENRTVQP
jgi:DNA-binding NtrC family response regulator